MQTQYFKEYSRYMKREMEFKVYGHAGQPCLVLPAMGHRFYEFEDCGMVDAAARWIEAGQLQLFCADALNGAEVTPQAQERWFCYLTEELLPRLRALNGSEAPVLAAGCGQGACQAVNLHLRRPEVCSGVIGLSGRYETANVYGHGPEDLIYRNGPLAYLPHLTEKALERLRRQEPMMLCAGRGPGDEQALEETRRMGEALEALKQAENGFEFTVRQELSRAVFLLAEKRIAQPERPPDRTGRDGQRMKAMLKFVQEHFAEELTASQIAHSAGLSASECLRCFHAVIGTTPMQYVKTFRVQQAAQLLEGTDWPVAKVGRQCGFKEMGYFARAFREVYHCTPTEHRRAILQKKAGRAAAKP